MKTFYCALIVTAMSCHVVLADEADDAKKSYLTASEAGAEFAVQGEYSGGIKSSDGELKLGLQVIAEGGGKLAWVAYTGG